MRRALRKWPELAGAGCDVVWCGNPAKNLLENVSERGVAIGDRKRMEKEITMLRQKLAERAENQAENIGNIAFVGKVLGDTPPRDLKPMADNLRQGASHSVICLVSAFEGKPYRGVG